MTRWCGIHHGSVQDTEAEIVDWTESTSGPDTPVYACAPCIRRDGIVPRRTFIGRRDAAPIAPQ